MAALPWAKSELATDSSACTSAEAPAFAEVEGRTAANAVLPAAMPRTVTAAPVIGASFDMVVTSWWCPWLEGLCASQHAHAFAPGAAVSHFAWYEHREE